MNDYNSNKKTGKALIPRFRFPEFQNSGEWEVKKLGEIGKIITGSTPSKKDPKNWNGNFVWITAQDFKGKYISDSIEKLTDKGKSISRIVPKNSVLVTCIASIGLNAINKVECATNQQINAIICRDKIAYHEFIYYCIVNSENRLKNIAGHTAVPIINKSDFEKFAIPLPSLPEQQKIASCLSSIDEVIAGERQKLELLKAHKKGLLQNLFPREGETVPKWRFPEFKDSGEWEEKIIGEIGETINGLTNKSANDFGKGSPFITYLQVYEDSMVNLDKCSFVNIELNEKQNTIHKGDILITTSSETPDEVGFASVMLNEPAQDTYLNSFCFCLRPHKKANLLPEFSRYLFRSNLYRKQINKIAQGITRFNLSKQSFLKVLLLIPPLPEQQKIADCLSSLDELINAQQQKIELLEQHKKGLLQGLFPNVNDVDNG